MFEEFSRPDVMRKPLLLGAKFRGVRLQSACRSPQRMLHMQHFMIKNKFHCIRWHVALIQPLVHHNLIERRIVTSKLGAPRPGAPSEARPAKPALEVFRIERSEHRLQIVRRAQRIVLNASRALSANARDVPPRGMRQSEFAIERAQFARHSPAIYLPEQYGGSGLDHRDRRRAQNIGKPHVGHVLPQTNRVRKICVRVQLHEELRRPALASQSREDALKNMVTAGKRDGNARILPQACGSTHDGLRRTGGAAIPFEAFSTSFCASCVASIASSRFSLYVSRSMPLAESP